MTEKITSIARNTSYFTLALVIQKIISLVYFTIYARVLGPADLGQYYFAISITSIFSIFIDFGLGNVITREVAKQPTKASSLLGSVLSIKLIFSAITILGLLIWTQAWHYEPLTRDLIYISALVMIFDNFTNTCYSILRGFHNLKFESIASVAFQSIVLVFSLVVIGLGLDIRWLMMSLVTASIFNLGYSALVVRKKLQLRLSLTWDKVLIKQILLIALPFAVYAIFQRFYTFFDSVLLFKFSGAEAVGLYQIPFKIIVAIQFLPMAFTASLYPALSAYWQHNREQLGVTFERAITYSLILGIPIMIGTIALADQIVLLFKEGFSSAAWPLQVSMMAVPFMFLSFPIGSLLNACDRQKRNTINIIIIAIASALLNIYLIPRFGVIGACVTNLITSIGLIILGWHVVPEIITIRKKKLYSMLVRITGAGIVMGLFAFYVKSELHPIGTIALAGIVYVICLYLLKGFTKADLESIMLSFKKKV
jgi:O-antigen/teichoic acid export membrane protein